VNVPLLLERRRFIRRETVGWERSVSDRRRSRLLERIQQYYMKEVGESGPLVGKKVRGRVVDYVEGPE